MCPAQERIFSRGGTGLLNIYYISISLDGPAKTHDAMRITATQTGSHRRAVAAIQQAFSIYPEGVAIRVTLAPPYDVFGAYDYFHSLGIPDKAVGIGRLTPVNFIGNAQPDYDKTAASWGANRTAWHSFLADYLHRLQTRRGGYFIRSVLETLDDALLPSDSPQLRTCSLVSPAVLPGGAIVPCLKLAFDDSAALGDTTLGISPAKSLAFRKQVPSSVRAFKPCRACFARYTCGGPCYALNKAQTGSLAGFSDIGCDVKREGCISELFLAALWTRTDPQFVKKMRANQLKGKKDKLQLETLFANHYLKK